MKSIQMRFKMQNAMITKLISKYEHLLLDIYSSIIYCCNPRRYVPKIKNFIKRHFSHSIEYEENNSYMQTH